MKSEPRLPYGQGTYRRRIRLLTHRKGVLADLEDDFHRFRVRLAHDGERVTGIVADALRWPWTTCPGATKPLEHLIGMRLSRRTSAVAEHTDFRAQCTHLFDLAGLAVAHAAAGRRERWYDLAVPDRVEQRTRVRIARDGKELFTWELRGNRIEGPPPFTGVRLLGRAFLEWCERELDEDGAEAAIALRRACYIAMGRITNLDTVLDPSPYYRQGAECHTFRPGTVEQARRQLGMSRE